MDAQKQKKQRGYRRKLFCGRVVFFMSRFCDIHFTHLQRVVAVKGLISALGQTIMKP